jgi:hypothetical protein
MRSTLNLPSLAVESVRETIDYQELFFLVKLKIYVITVVTGILCGTVIGIWSRNLVAGTVVGIVSGFVMLYFQVCLMDVGVYLWSILD